MSEQPEQQQMDSDKSPESCSNSPESNWDRRVAVQQRNPGWPGAIAIFLVRGYQLLISPWLGRNCRFYPSCSQYFILSVRKDGLVKAVWKGGLRICRCHPWNSGGYDPP